MLMSIILLPQYPCSHEKRTCEVTNILKINLHCITKALMAVQCILRVKMPYKPLAIYSDAPCSFTRLVMKSVNYSMCKKASNISKHEDVFTGTLPFEDFSNPSYPTIIILLGGGKEGVYRINCTTEFMQQNVQASACLYFTILQIYLCGLICKISPNVILHPVVRMTGQVHFEICCAEHFVLASREC